MQIPKYKDQISDLVVGKHILELVSKNSNNCRDTFSQNVEIYSNPMVNFNAKDTICLSNIEQYKGEIQSDTQISFFQWNFGEPTSTGNVNVTDIEPWFTYNSIGLKTVQLMAETVNGCRDSVAQDITITDATSIDNPQINYVTFVDNQTIEISFEKSSINRFGQYHVTDGTKSYDVLDQNETTITIDLVSMPVNSNCYELKVEDYCQLIGLPSVAHCYMILSVSSTQSYENQLNWTPYECWYSVLEYDVFKLDENGVFTKLATIDGSTTSYTDDGLCDQNYEYYVEAVDPTETFRSKSYKVSQRPTYV
ncbi:hypothetical protein OAD66_09465, partial [Bacteroidia bacterium]|nr:hypothetical protein [Bacteroidia bacterium]